jgi:hypothetical protein
MCGIFGFSFHDGEKELVSEGRRALLAYKLAEGNDSRGGHSWGVVHINGDRFKIERGLGHLTERPFQLLGAHTMMAHTRFATHGDKTVANAHPFEFDTLVGAHNGVFSNHYSLNRVHKRDFAVDSMHAFAHIEEGLNFSEIEGYGTLEWFKKDRPKRIYLCQMRSGDLSVYGLGSTTDNKTRGVAWSSDDKHLKEALRCAGLKKCFEYKIKREHIYYVEDGVLYVTDDKLELSVPEYQHNWRNGYSVTSNVGRWDPKLGVWIDEDDDARGFVKKRYYDSKTRDWSDEIIILDDVKYAAFMNAPKREHTQPILLGPSSKEKDSADMKEARELAERAALAYRIIDMAADMGDEEAILLLRQYNEAEIDETDLIEAVEEGGAGSTRDEIPSSTEERADQEATLMGETERMFPGSAQKFQSTMDEMRERWERMARAEETGYVDPRDEDIAMFMRGR